MRYFFLMLFFCFSLHVHSQQDSIPSEKKIDSLKQNPSDSLLIQKTTDTLIGRKKDLKEVIKKRQVKRDSGEITIKYYKIISHTRDTTFLDTTLTIQKEYKYNYLRRDDFELMPFSNVGQPYNQLGLDLERSTFYPSLGARAKNYKYLEVEDIDYYNVATPMTELFFKTTFEQGQLLDASLTFNTSRRLNFSIAYTGFRSLGKYQFSQAQSGNFRTTTNYITKNGRYSLRAHIAAQDIDTEENGGLSNKELQFESDDPEFSDRSRIDVFFTDANNKVLGKRYYWEHQYKLIKKERDSGSARSTSLAFGHTFNYETKFYQFTQTAQNDYFGPSFLTPIEDKARLKTMYNEVNAEFFNTTLGSLTGYAALYNYNYFFNSILITDTQEIQNQLKGEEISLGARYAKKIGSFQLSGNGAYTLSGDLTGTILDASAAYNINDNNRIMAGIHASSRLPNFNFLLYQSDYQNYNWQNTSVFEKERVNGLQFSLQSKLLGNLTAKYTTTDNYTYFASEATPQQLEDNQENAAVKPFQENNSVNYLKIKYNKEFRVGMFALNNTVMYQNVTQSNDVLNLPQLVTRNTLYFSSDVFKKAMFIQTGVTFKYFTAYNMNAYNPVLGEFYIQNNEEFGGYPLLDFFINAKVRQTRIYLKAEHFNSSFGETNMFYAAPNYPYRDFVIRFGLVWNFFS